MKKDKAPTVDFAGRVCGTRAANSASVSVSLPVIQAHPKPRPSKMGWKRAAVLIGVHVVFAIHLLQWYVSGMGDGRAQTLSPIEPSESMFTLELGKINAGFVFFVLAILSTVIFGRFFCGWGCHIVALQDLCAWFMKKLGVRPRQFRTRLLLLMPLAMALYMFVWPTFKREALQPLVTWAWGADAYESLEPYIGLTPPRPDFKPQFTVESFWETFGEWYMAIPFLGVCGFATVYFLGAKGFCTYGCPYGGFFRPIDRLSVGRIKVNDNCEQCGHCTAACSSNVRVHEEIRDYGMVMDPGCMKCLDCVSVCPNDALSIGPGLPSLLKATRTDQAKKRRKKHRVPYDLNWSEELWVGALFFILTWYGFRGMLDSMPLLMSAGLGGVVAFSTWKLVRLAFDKNVRLSHLQLKHAGRLKRAGWIFIPCATLLLAFGAWGTIVKFARWTGEMIDYDVHTPSSVVFSAGYVPDVKEKSKAEAALRAFRLGDSIHFGGIGWSLSTENISRVAWLQAVCGDLDACVETQERVVGKVRAWAERTTLKNTRAKRHASLAEAIDRLVDFYGVQGRMPDSVRRFVDEQAVDEPGLGLVWLRKAALTQLAGNLEDAIKQVEHAVELNRSPEAHHAEITSSATRLLAQWGRLDAAQALVERELALDHASEPAGLRLVLSTVLASRGSIDEAVSQARKSCELDPREPQHWLMLSQLQQYQGKEDDSIATLRSGVAARPKAAALRRELALALAKANRVDEAAEQLRAWARLEPYLREPWQILAGIEIKRGRKEVGVEVLREGVKHRSNDPLMRLNLADGLFAAGSAPAALEEVRRAVSFSPDDAGVRGQAVALLRAAGQAAEAADLEKAGAKNR